MALVACLRNPGGGLFPATIHFLPKENNGFFTSLDSYPRCTHCLKHNDPVIPEKSFELPGAL